MPTGPEFYAKVRQEADIISQDERNTGSYDTNWSLAEKIITDKEALTFVTHPAPGKNRQDVKRIDAVRKHVQALISANKSNQPEAQRTHIANLPAQHRHDQPPRPEPDTQPQTQTRPERRPPPVQTRIVEVTPLLEHRTYLLQEVFDRISGEPQRENNPFFINRVPTDFALNDSQIDQLQLTAPFYEDITGANDRITAKLNQRANPSTRYGLNNNARFLAAASVTSESGLMGTAAACAPIPELQAQLFKLIATQIITIHRQKPDLLKRWYQAQHQQSGLNSLKVFQFLDTSQINPTSGQLEFRRKPEDRRMVVFDSNQFLPVWKRRIQLLQKSLAQDKFRPVEFRWLGFLSNSIKMDQLLQMIKITSQN